MDLEALHMKPFLRLEHQSRYTYSSLSTVSIVIVNLPMMNGLPFFPNNSKDDVQTYLDSSAPLLRLLDDDYEEEKEAFSFCLQALGMAEDFNIFFPSSISNKEKAQAANTRLSEDTENPEFMLSDSRRNNGANLVSNSSKSSRPTHFEILRARRNEDYYDHKTDAEFFDELRVTRTTFNQLLSYLKQNEYFKKNYWGGNFAIKAETVLQIFLDYAGKRTTFKELSVKYCVCESAIMSNFARCVAVLNELESIEIEWPSEPCEFEIIQNGFEQKSKLEGVIGSMGTCFIEMRTTKEPPAGYKIGRQQSIMHLLAVADADLKFTYVHAGFPGTFTSEEAFESSELGQSVDDPDTKLFPSQNLHLVASSDYSLRERLMVPYFKPHSESQKTFNDRINQANSINDAFIHLKSRFRVFQSQFCSSLEKIPNIVKACCVIHNIALNDPQDYDYLKPYLISELPDFTGYVDDSDFEHPCPTAAACVKRQRLTDSM